MSHTLDLPGDAQLVSGPDGFNGIKLGDVYISPLLTYLQTSDIGSAPQRLVELSAELKDRVLAYDAGEEIAMGLSAK